MQLPTETAAIRRVHALLVGWFGDAIRFPPRTEKADLVATLPGARLVFELKQSTDAAAVRRAIDQVRSHAGRNAIPVVAVPFMSKAGKQMCAEAAVSWMDLSGNADIRGPKLRVLVNGEPNRFVARGRPSTPYAPKTSRVIRYLLAHPTEAFTQRALARETGVDASNVARLIARLRADGIVKRDEHKRIALADRKLALASWRAAYRFDQHDIIRAHVPARSGTDAVVATDGMLSALQIRHAFTGLAGAWAYSQYANYRLVTVYVDRVPTAAELLAIDAVEQAAGANVWFVVPKDPGVFDGARVVNGLDVVHPVQVWIDLAAQPERSTEAADELYDQIVKGTWDG